MGNQNLTQFISTFTQTNPPRKTVLFWLSLSLGFALLYSGLGLNQAFAGPFVVQDDARQHVFWMQRFLNPELFPDDLIADYFQSVAPIGYQLLYRFFAVLGIPPLLFNKLLPLFLDAGITVLGFYLTLALLPIPVVGFMSTLLLNQTLWMTDELASGTPRAFFYPLLLSFLCTLTRRSLLGCVVCILLQGWFYPHTVFLSVSILLLRLISWRQGRLRMVGDAVDYRLFGLGLGAALVVLLPYALQTSGYGPTVSLGEARLMPEFLPGGRVNFFDDNVWEYWLEGRSGLFYRTVLSPATLGFALLLPLLWIWRKQFPLLRQLTRHWVLLPQLLIASLGMFGLAHATLFRLHLPSRYTHYSFPILLALAAAITLATILQSLLHWVTVIASTWQQGLMLGLIGLCYGISLIGYPAFLDSFLGVNYHTGHQEQLYAFLAQQPQDIQIASLAKETGNIPTFAARSVLVSPEHSIPYQMGYYRQFRQRVKDLIRAQYSPDLATLLAVIRQYQIDYWLLEPHAFDLTTSTKQKELNWFNQYQPEARQAIANLEQGKQPALQKYLKPCTVFNQSGYRLISAQCLQEASR